MGGFDLLVRLIARLASTARLDEIVEAVVPEIVELGFGSVWIAVLDEQTGNLSTLKAITDGVDTTPEAPAIITIEVREPLGRGFRERRLVNVTAPEALHIIERDEDVVPPDALALPRARYDDLRGRPFAAGPLLGSRRQPVGAVTLSSYCGSQPIPDGVLSGGLARALLDHLAIAMERALHVAQIERLQANLGALQAAMVADAPIKSVGELAAWAAHDLNNLSTFALYNVGVALRSPAEALDMLPRIERTNRAIGEVVARLQRSTRPSSGDAVAANLPQIVDDVVIMATPTLRERSVEVEVELAAVPLVRCDAGLIRRVVLNLLINALDALDAVPPEARRIKIRVRDDDGMVRLIVADTGPGIAPEILKRMFQRFASTKGSHRGLGLAAVHAALAPFGGHLEGRNAPTGGAVFEVTLVAAPPGTPDSAAGPRPGPRPTAAEGPRRIRILALDDEPDVAEIIRHHLDPLGHEVVSVTDPAQAIEVATTQVFDLVLCDIRLQKQSGLDVCVSLRREGFRGKLVLMTGWDTQALRSDRRAAECDALLKKPFEGAELIHVIDSLFTS